jgi:hypothetical protein
MTISECVRSSPSWGVVKSLGYYRRGPVGLIRAQKFQLILNQKTHFGGRELQDDPSAQGGHNRASMSVVGGKAEIICSHRAFQLLTHCGHQPWDIPAMRPLIDAATGVLQGR